MVVEGHAGHVEAIGRCGVAGELNGKRLDVGVVPSGSSCEFVQVLDDVLLGLCEGDVEPLLGEQAGDAIRDELVVAVERRDRE